ncbi:MAG TPA: hypothetical protein VMZ71_06320, partial [Gemmataceae bacterium]|nr:hypothetical protein [Gemmataceae bacterium]
YDIKRDVGEQNDLAAARPELVRDLRARLHAWRREVGAQMPTPNPKYDLTKPEYTPPPPKAKKKEAK